MKAFRLTSRTNKILGPVLILCLTVGAQCGLAATFVVNNLDSGTGIGFDDPTVVAPVMGNSGTTLGAQRLIAFQAAADDWGAILKSDISIEIDASMTALTCAPGGGALGFAGPQGMALANFTNAPVADTLFPQALANSLGGTDLDGANADISAQFNRLVDDDDPNCLTGVSWSYVIGAAAPPNTLPFTETVLHELSHGLGFLTFTDLTTGERAADMPDHYNRHLVDETPAPTGWNDLDNAGRIAAAIDTGELTWDGPEVDDVDQSFTTGLHPISGRTIMYAPAPVEVGSSVSHWDTAMEPDELMEPLATPTSNRLMTNHLMLDLGWNELVSMVVTKTDGLTDIDSGSATSYTVTVTNNGPGDIWVTDASVADTFSAAMLNPTWTCAGSGGATCGAANGNGDINTTVSVPLGGVATFTIDATVDPGFTGTLSNTVTLTMPSNILNTASNSASDNTLVSSADDIFSDGFED